jgi:hypothetical protein
MTEFDDNKPAKPTLDDSWLDEAKLNAELSNAGFDAPVFPWPDAPPRVELPFAPIPYQPEPQQETVRRSGLAWSAGIVFFGSVAFMLFLGWIADVLLGTSPWGLVAGIVLGSVIGFVQFFRISSQIFGNTKPKNEIHTLMSPPDDDRENGSLF